MVAGRRCLLAWADCARVARMTLAARGAGALSAVVVDPARPPDADRVLEEQGRWLGLEAEAARLLRRGRTHGPVPHLGGAHDCDAPLPWWLAAELGSAETGARVGRVDVAVDGSQLIHWPDPLRRLRALAASGAEHVLFETPLLAEGEAPAGYLPGSVWYAASMSAAQSAAIAEYWEQRGVSLPQYRPGTGGVASGQARTSETTWWSFADLRGIEHLLRNAGLRLLRSHSIWGGRAAVIVAGRRA
jgi:hypothetical protein